MSSRVVFVIETMEVIDGQKLKSAHPDKYGYYTVPLAVIGRTTLNKTYYIPQYFVESMTGANSPFAMQVRSGNMFGEWGHPFTKDLERISLVLEEKYAHHLRKVYTRELPDGTTLILGEVKPFGPYKDCLEESLASPFINTAFSLRSLCTESFNREENRIDRIIKHFVTFDAVGSSGYKESSKRYVNLGSANESFNFSMEIKPDYFYKKDGELITAYESKNIISDTWLTDLFDAKEVVITSKSIPVKYIKGNNNLIDNSGKRKSFVQSIWS